MRSVTVRTADLKNIIINLGFVGENEHRQIRFDAKKDFEEYPHASASLTVVPPEGESYPAIIERNGDFVLWTITDSDVIGNGDGEIQLVFTEGEVVKRTCVARTKTDRSLVPTGSIPSGIDDFITRAGAALTAIPETINEALAEAKASGEFDGPAGPAGADGQDGFSPTATVVKSGKTATITITDKNGTTTAQVSDGEGGGTSDYSDLTNKPQIAGVTLSGNKSLADLGADPTSIIDDTAGDGDTGKVWSADKSADTASSLLSDLNHGNARTEYVEDAVIAGKKIIYNASINENGVIETVSTGRNLICFKVKQGVKITASGTFDLYAFYTSEPDIASVSYNNSRSSSSILKNTIVPNGCTWVAIRVVNGKDIVLIPKSAEISEALNQIGYIGDALICNKKVIHDASISSGGLIGTANSGKKLVCYRIKAGTKISATGDIELYAFYEDEPKLTSVSYNNSRTVSSSLSNYTVPIGCKWVAVRCDEENDVELTPVSETLLEINEELEDQDDRITDIEDYLADVVIDVTVEWDQSLVISPYGSLKDIGSNNIKISKPIPVKKGDVVKLTGYLSTQSNISWTSQEYLNTLGGLPTFLPLSVGSGNSQRTETATVPLDGYIIVSAFVAYDCELKIERTFKSQQEENARIAIDSQLRHNYVDKYDFVPNLEKKRTNSILTYSADDKKESNFLVNAVAYPNGEIIGCRAGSGQVVKIANDGTETVLMTISNAQDWRGVFMDSNLNVYVSPHSATFSPEITNTDRGLYRLEYGESQFEKVIALCHDIFITKWVKNHAYSVGNTVFVPNVCDIYVCKTAHTSGSTFSDTNWNPVSAWVANTAYTSGDLVKHNYNYFVCTTSHTSGATFDFTKFAPATEYIDNDDTIWTMCEDADGNLYAGVYAHSMRDNPAIYKSYDNGATWNYVYNFITNGGLTPEYYSTSVQHVHCVNYNEYDRCLYAAVGETNTVLRSDDGSSTWEDLHIPCVYGQPTYVMGVKNGLLIGSDGHYACGVSKLMTDGKTLKRCGRTAPGFIFNIRRSDLTGWLYAFTRIDNHVGDTADCPPVEAITDPDALEAWKTSSSTSGDSLKKWTEYNKWASIYYPEDAIRPQNAVMMVSKDEGETWEVFKTIKCSQNYASICGFITVGYFRDGECLVGCLMPIEGTTGGKAFVQPFIVSEGKKKRTASGFDLTGEIFIKTNSSTTVAYE